MVAFLFELIGICFGIGIVIQLLGCGKDAVSAIRVRFRRWLMKDDDVNKVGG